MRQSAFLGYIGNLETFSLINEMLTLKHTVMMTLAIPLAPLAYALKSLVIANPPLGLVVGAAAMIGYSIYEDSRKK